MTTSSTVKEQLQKYYDENHIIPDGRFACAMLGRCPGDFARGMQCHVGSRYGERTRIMVAAMDCGYGGKNTIDERTEKVVSNAQKGVINPHMRWTFKALSLFLDEEDPKELVHYMIMTNTCKCCHKNDSKHMAPMYYYNCGMHTRAEVSIIKPEVILFQGQLASTGCQEYLEKIEGLEDEEIRSCLRILRMDGFSCFAVVCIHPSAYGRNMARKIRFYDRILPKVAKYIRENINQLQ